MRFPLLDMLVWSLGAVVHACLLAALVIKARWREYPLFTSFVIVQNLYVYFVYLAYRINDPDTYTKVYWVFEAYLFLLEIAVAGEMFVCIWRFDDSLKFLPWRRFALWAGISLLVAAAGSFFVGTATMPKLDLYAMRGSVFTSFLLCGVFVGFSMEFNRLRLRRPKHPMLIGWGLTGIAVLELSEDLRFYAYGWHWSSDASDRTGQVLYACIVVYWTIGMWRRDSLIWPRASAVSPNKRRRVG